MLMLAGVSMAQGVVFSYSSIAEGLEEARENDRVVIAYLFDESAGGFEAYSHLWSDPMIGRFAGDMAVAVAIDVAGDEGEAFRRHVRRRNKGDDVAPGIYFFSATGRSLGALHGDLSGVEGVGRVMMMLGVADYASGESKGRRGRRYHRARWHR